MRIISTIAIILTLLQGQLFAQVQMLDVKWHGEIVDTDSLTINSTNVYIKILPDGSVNGMFNGKVVEFSIPIEDDYHVLSVDWFVTDSLHIIFYEESIGTQVAPTLYLWTKKVLILNIKKELVDLILKSPFSKVTIST